MDKELQTDENTDNLIIENQLLKQQNAELSAKLKWYEDQFRLNQQRLYGKSSEQHLHDEQISIFNEAEVEAQPDASEPAMEEIHYKRRKQVGKREADLKDLPVETIEYRLTEEEQVCDVCGGDLHEMSKQVRKEIKIIPPQVTVVDHVSYVYSCRDCEQNEIHTPVITAPTPNPVIPKSIASPSSVAYIMDQKFTMGLPLYRQEQQMERLGIPLSRQTMANWMIYASENWLTPLYDRLHVLLLQRDIAQADETILQVLREPGRSADTNSYMWLYRTGRDGPHIVLYDYQTTRASKHPEKFLATFKGYLNVDGYQGYLGLPNITLVGCHAHARREFAQIVKSFPSSTGKEKTASQKGLEFFERLYAIEKRLKDAASEERYEARLRESRPVLDELWEWIQKILPQVPPKTALGKAVRYCRNQKEKLEAFLLDGRLEIDNNRSERSIKPFVMGRKAWLFSNTPRGATASAVIYSIVETAKENGLKPLQYLTWLFEQLPNARVNSSDSLDVFLPWSDNVPLFCKTHS